VHFIGKMNAHPLFGSSHSGAAGVCEIFAGGQHFERRGAGPRHPRPARRQSPVSGVPKFLNRMTSVG
jgi:hypothetical protein